MTPDREVIRQEIKSWLNQFGWPEVFNPDMFVINNLDPLFHHLASRGLVPLECYTDFVVVATDVWQKKSWGIF
jgi:hypothetical protein